MKKIMILFVGLLLFSAVNTGLAQQMKGMEGTPKVQSPSTVEDQLRQIQEELKALRNDVNELKRESGSRVPMGQRMGPGMMRGQTMQPMMDMMQGCMQMMGMMGDMGGMTPPQKKRPQKQS